MREAVVVFGKTARAGNVKTRLSPPLEPAEAASLYEAFARDVLCTVAEYRDNRDAEVDAVLAWEGMQEDVVSDFACGQLGFDFFEQPAGDLGKSLRAAVDAVRDRGARRVVVVGTDSPTLSVQQLETAGELLEEYDVVFGPTFDGGYYLVGVDETGVAEPSAQDVIFEDIPWSSPRVLEVSWRRATEGGLLCELMGFWYDVDTIDDLKKARFHLFEYLADRQPRVGRHTRQILETEFGGRI